MRTVPLSEAQGKLSSLIEDVEMTHEIIRITQPGRGVAVLMAEDALESLHETLFWLCQQQVVEEVAASRSASREGRTMSCDDLRAAIGLPAL